MIPAEIQQRTSRGGDPVSRPAQKVELRQGSCFLRLDVFQIEAAHKEVLTPDMLGHQVHLNETRRQTVEIRSGNDGRQEFREVCLQP